MVTKIEENRYSSGKDVNIIGENLMKHDWARSGGMSLPRMRRPEDSAAGLIMEWANVASWLLKPDPNLLSSTSCISNNSVNNHAAPSINHCRTPSDMPVSCGPTICTAIRCTVPGCDCDCFLPGKLHVRYCENCKHSWVPHALDKLGFRDLFAPASIEPVQSNVVFDIASLVLYGCQALPIKLKILLDRLFDALQKDEITQILRGFGWSQEDYARGYILQETHGNVLKDHWNICTPDEEPLVYQQFLRFGETRRITQQLLLHGLGDLRPTLPRTDSDSPKLYEKNMTKGLTGGKNVEETNRSDSKYSSNLSSCPIQKLRSNPLLSSSPPNITSPLLPSALQLRGKYASLFGPQPHPATTPLSLSPQQPQQPPAPPPLPPPPPPKHSPLNFVKLPQTGLTCTPIPTTTPPVTSSQNSASSTTPVNMSPLNKLQKMQPFDFRQIASGIFQSSKLSGERRRPSETSDTSQSGLNLCVTSPSTLLTHHPPIAIPPVSVTPYPKSNAGRKSPVVDFSASKNSSEFDSEDSDDEEVDEHQNALNLSKDAGPRSTIQRHGHSRKASTPVKRGWSSSNLPLNLGTQLINPATGKKRVQCNVCLKTFCDKGALKIHFSAVHLREMHKCTVEGCNMMFSSRRSRNRHSANPNPKLHSPHLRRKISPHDGRSSQAHPILMPPLQPGLHPLNFAAFPFPPTDLCHPMSGVDLKRGFEGFIGAKDDMFTESMDNQDDYGDYDDEDGIIVDDGGMDDDENDSETNSGEQAESTQSKRIKMSESDGDEDGASNTDSNESRSMTLSDHQPLKEEHDSRSRNSRKRKSQKPTRCQMRAVSSEDEQLSNDYSDEMIFSSAPTGNGNACPVETEAPKLEQEKEWDLSKSAVKVEENSETPSSPGRDEQDGESGVAEGSHEPSNELDEKPALPVEESKPNEECLNLCKSNEPSKEAFCEREESERGPLKVENRSDEEGEEIEEDEPLNFAGDTMPSSPARSQGSAISTGSCDSDENEDGSASDVPLDQDNPRRCTACGKIFQNHFGVKTHFQNVHLKLMHKCVVDGCNAAFPSKRSRDRHSGNENLHRKLLSTSDSSVPAFGPPPSSLDNATYNSPPPPPLQTQSNLPNDFLSRLYGENQNIPLTAASPKTTNGDLITSHPPLIIPALTGLPFPPLCPYPTPHLSPALNGKTTESLSPSKSPHLLVYNLEEDLHTPDQDNMFHCRFCSKPFAELITLKEHYERNHMNEMFRCHVPGCFQVFSSRTKRNLHSQSRLLHSKEISAS